MYLLCAHQIQPFVVWSSVRIIILKHHPCGLMVLSYISGNFLVIFYLYAGHQNCGAVDLSHSVIEDTGSRLLKAHFFPGRICSLKL